MVCAKACGLVTERFDGLHEAPTVEEYDLGVLNTQAHSRGSASFRQCSDDGANRLGASRIIDDPHPLFEFATLVPRGVLQQDDFGPRRRLRLAKPLESGGRPSSRAPSMFALLPAPSLLHFGEMRFMRFEALFEALFDVMQPPEGSIPPPLPGQIGVPFRRPGRVAVLDFSPMNGH
jgi:hypothetical protein